MTKTRQIFLHAAVWASILLFFMLLSGSGKITYKAVIMVGYFGLINIATFYINYLIILPKLLNKRKYLLCGVTIAGLVLVSGLVKYGLAIIFEDLVLVRGENQEHRLSFWSYYLSAIFIGCFFMFLSTALKFMVDWFINEKVRTNLENEKLTAELAFLKSQINPHFLFNTLNNIYSLAYQQSDKTPAAVLKLSEIMRYMLYESNEDMVDLSKEIRYLENYIELQRLRFKNDAYVDLQIIGEAQDQKIMPLVLISFVENAFKHGVATDEQHPIEISINIEPERLIFKVSNTVHKLNKDLTGGIGLINVKKRLDLFYHRHYNLEIDNHSDRYTSELCLDLRP
ncbi:histidine kinase [Flavihumibacter sp. R14]|nr:histidine kinase [Flavihumibacter soli]